MEMVLLGKQSKGVPIDEQAKDEVVPLDRLRAADRLADSPCDTRPQRQRLAFTLLRGTLARAVNFGARCRVYVPQGSGEKRVRPKGASNAWRGNKPSSCRWPQTYAKTAPV